MTIKIMFKWYNNVVTTKPSTPSLVDAIPYSLFSLPLLLAPFLSFSCLISLPLTSLGIIPAKGSGSVMYTLPSGVWGKTPAEQKLIRRWGSERKLFYYNISHVLQNTKKRTYFVQQNANTAH